MVGAAGTSTNATVVPDVPSTSDAQVAPSASAIKAPAAIFLDKLHSDFPQMADDASAILVAKDMCSIIKIGEGASPLGKRTIVMSALNVLEGSPGFMSEPDATEFVGMSVATYCPKDASVVFGAK